MPTDEEIKAAEAKAAEEKAAGEKKATVDDLTPAQTRQALQYVLTQNKTLAGELNQIKGQIGEISKVRAAAPAKGTEDEEAPDLETMSRTEFANFLVSQVEKKLVKPAVDQVVERDSRLEAKSIKQEIKEFEKDHPEFWTFADEVKGILGKHPELNIEEAFTLARHSAPDKAKQVDEAAIEAKRKEREKVMQDRRESFGGLLPTSGKATKAKNMTAKDAANQAWEDLGMSEHLAAISAE